MRILRFFKLFLSKIYVEQPYSVYSSSNVKLLHIFASVMVQLHLFFFLLFFCFFFYKGKQVP